MTTLPKQIAEKFFAELAKFEDVEAGQIEALQALMDKSGKLKAADVEAIFKPSGDAKL